MIICAELGLGDELAARGSITAMRHLQRLIDARRSSLGLMPLASPGRAKGRNCLIGEFGKPAPTRNLTGS